MALLICMTACIIMSYARKWKSKLLTWLEMIIFQAYMLSQSSNRITTTLVLGVLPHLVQFDVPKMRNHLCSCLKAGKMEMFPFF